MQVDLPFTVEYLTPDTVPISEVIDSLVAVKALIEEGGMNLPLMVRGLQIESIRVSVRSISQESPLREVLLVSIFLAFQDELESEVPGMIEHITGTDIPDSFDSLVTVSVLIALFYGAAYLKDVVTRRTIDTPLRRKYKELVSDLAVRTGRSEEEIEAILEKRYAVKARLSNLVAAVVKFFKPSKSQDNVEIIVSDRRIEPRLISDVPPEYIYEDDQKALQSTPFENVVLEIHAQDRDHEASGWAAIGDGLCSKRVRMKLLDGVGPEQLWNKNSVKGDGVLVSKRVGMDFVPYEIHLTKIHD